MVWYGAAVMTCICREQCRGLGLIGAGWMYPDVQTPHQAM